MKYDQKQGQNVKPLRVCLVSQRAYPTDPRISQEILAIQEQGFKMDLVVWRNPQQPEFTPPDGIRIYRVPALRRQRAGKIRYIMEYISFFVPAFFLVALLHLRNHYDVIHVTNLPDLLVFTSLIPRLLGAKIVFELREITPEMFMDRFSTSEQSRIIKLMAWLEQRSIDYAHGAITTNPTMLQAVLDRGADPDKFVITFNVGDMRITQEPTILPDTSPIPAGMPFEILSHGTILERQGYAVLIQAMPLILRSVPDARLTILGQGPFLPTLIDLVKELDLAEVVSMPGFKSGQDLVNELRKAHVGVVPVLLNPETAHSQTHKMYEYIHLGIPVIVSRTPAVTSTFDDIHLALVTPGSVESLAEVIIDLAQNPQKRSALAKNAFNLYEENLNPEQQRRNYINLLTRLTGTSS